MKLENEESTVVNFNLLPTTYFPINRGENNRDAKLTDSKVILIISMRMAGFTTTLLGEMFGVDSASISAICRNKTWVHIDRSKITAYVTFKEEIKCEGLDL
jgi:hypothetical protein